MRITHIHFYFRFKTQYKKKASASNVEQCECPGPNPLRTMVIFDSESSVADFSYEGLGCIGSLAQNPRK